MKLGALVSLIFMTLFAGIMIGSSASFVSGLLAQRVFYFSVGAFWALFGLSKVLITREQRHG